MTNNPSSLAALVLAGGDSSRMGRTKALLEYDGVTFLEAVCAGVRSAAVAETVVVLGASRSEVLAAWQPMGSKVAFNETPELGQIASVRAGLRALSPEISAAMICLVDQPTIRPETYELIADLWRSNNDALVIPKCKRNAAGPAGAKPCADAPLFKRGHPIIIPRKYFNLCHEGPAEKGLHWVTHHPSVKALDIIVEDENIIRDFDTPEDYQKLRSEKSGDNQR